MSTSSDGNLNETVATICLQTYPELRSQRILNLDRISDGWECDVYRFDLEGEERGALVRQGLILRIYLGHGAVGKAREEFRVLRSLGLAGYPVPRVDAVVAEDSPLGQPLTLMERVDGTTLGNAMVGSSNPVDRDRYLECFCRLMVELHQVDWQPFVTDPNRYRPDEAVGRWVAEMRALLGSLNVSDFDDAFKWLEERASEIEPGRLSVVHWDFHPWNVLLRASGDPVVIDWTSAQITDSRFDLAWTLLLTEASRGEAMRDAVLAQYERLSNRPVNDLAVFEVAASVRRIASMVVSLSMGSEVFGMRPGAEAQMRRNLGHLVTAYELFKDRTGLRLPAAEAVLA